MSPINRTQNWTCMVLFIVLFVLSDHTQAKDNPKVVPAIQDKLCANSHAIRLEGYLGGKIDLCIAQRIKKQDVQALIAPFKSRTETRLWQTEFWGKWILSAIAAYQYNRDPELLTTIQEAARKLADHLLSQVGPGNTDIVKTGNYRGMPSSSILEPMVFLYNHTGEKKYLDFSKYIVAQWETADGPKLISKAMEGVTVAERFPFPKTWWSWENGQKAYEMMSCYEGLLELYRITGEPTYLKSAEVAVQNIIDTEINVAGSGTAFECFYHGARRQTEPAYHTMETCVTFTWMKLCSNLLRLTGNPMYADQIERTVYNALLASMKYDGSQIAKYSPLEGRRQAGEEQCGMHINCCNANGPRAFTLLPKIATQTSLNEIYINLYCQSSAVVPVNPKNNVSIEQKTSYPESDEVEIILQPDKPENFTLALRIPAWSNQTTISVNGNPVEGIKTGTYQKISRVWQKGDKVILKLDLSGRLINLNGYQAILRGPVLLARDSRFAGGFVDETAVVQQKDNLVELQPSTEKPEHVWMSFTAPLVLGTDLEGDFKKPRQVHFCDFGSAGNTWEQTSRYRVWISRTLNVMQTEYKAY